MKLLVVTQEINIASPTLGFFHEWVRMLSSRYESVEVICLSEGHHTLPGNVRVHSLGKEKGKASPVVYALRFLGLVWRLRHDYDVILVHMNQEYVLLSGTIWKLLGKHIYMWRNHYAGSWLTDVAASFCTKVFCTSKHSYTAKYRKTVLMPVGVDADQFLVRANAPCAQRSILFFSRIAPSKRADMFIDALALLHKQGLEFKASIYGSPVSGDEAYYAALGARVQEQNLADVVKFKKGVSKDEAPAIYQSHEIYVNCSPSGMFDKTLFEAAASGCLVLAISEDFTTITDKDLQFESTPESLATKLRLLLATTNEQKAKLQTLLISTAKEHSLPALMQELEKSINI